MSTNHHTPIISGAAANAATINAPLGQLDAKISVALDTDGTLRADAVDLAAVIKDGIVITAKLAADAVTTAKILDANVTAAKLAADAVTTAKILDANVTAAKLAADAVTTVKILDANVTAAKLADGAVPSPNLAFDAFNRNFGPGGSGVTQNGKLRWYSGSAATRVTDASNPFGSPTIRIDTTAQEGRKLWLAEMGVKIGDVLSFAIFAKVATGRSVRATLAWRNSSYASLGTAISATAVGNDGVFFLTIDAQTVPATCTNLDIYISQVSGSGTVDVYTWACILGSKIFQKTISEGIADGQQAMAQLGASLLTNDSSFQARTAYRDNLLLDPFARLLAPSTRKQDGEARWGTVTNRITRIDYDTSNPFGTPTLRIDPASTSVKRRFVLAEMGVSVGDKISLGALVKFPATSTMAVAYAFRASDGTTSTGALAGTAAAGTDALQFLTNKNITVPASSAYMDVYFSRSVGADTIDVYGMFACFGADISETGCKVLGYEQRFSAAGWALRRQVDPPESGLANLQSWRRAQAGLYRAEASKTARIVVIGDSITMTPSRWATAFQSRIAADLGGGLAGAGYVSLHATVYGNMSGWGNFTSVTKTGTWTQRDPGSTLGVGADGTDVLSTAAGDSFTISGTFDKAIIHYLKQSGGGTFKYSLDGGGSWSSNIDTSNATDLFATAVVTGATNTLKIYANGAGVRLLGVELWQTAVANGTILHKCAYTGASIEDFVTVSNGQPFKDALAQLAPDLVIVWLGANNASTNDYTNKTNLATLVANIKTATTVDVLLVAPYEHATAHNYEFSSLSDRMRELAKEQLLGMVDMRQYIDYRTTDPYGMFEDTTHINSYGGAVAAGAIYRALKW
jgi:predicted peroxiredoxin